MIGRSSRYENVSNIKKPIDCNNDACVRLAIDAKARNGHIDFDNQDIFSDGSIIFL